MSSIKTMLIAISVLGAFGCATQQTAPIPHAIAGYMNPREAIVAAADATPAAVPGMFLMQVRATGREGDRVYLNSEEDYRDQRNLTINVAPSAARALEARFGSPPEVHFQGKSILVEGAAERVRIDFTTNGRPSGKYYYQTHVAVGDAALIHLVSR